VANTLAYYDTAKITAVKSFGARTPTWTGFPKKSNCPLTSTTTALKHTKNFHSEILKILKSHFLPKNPLLLLH
jgi:hypothetical protein